MGNQTEVRERRGWFDSMSYVTTNMLSMAADDEPFFDPDREPLRESDFDDWRDFAAAPPDELDLVLEVDGMMTIFAAQRLVRVDVMRRTALRDAERHGRMLSDVIERSVRLELAAAMRITEYAAGEMIALADALVRRYPSVLDSLSHARMTERHASLLVTALDAVEPALREAVLTRAVRFAESEPVGVFRRSLRRLIDTVRSATLTERHQEALLTRRVVVESADDAMSWVHLFVPSVEAHAAHARGTAIAKILRAQPGETRSLDQIRADVMCDLLIDGDTSLHPERARGIRATVAVTVPVLALISVDGGGAGSEPAVVEGVGPIPIDRARELCGGADGWMRILTHPETGMVLSVGRDQYRPPPSLRKLVRWRADRCMAPGCGVPASRCEIDHSKPWEDGGTTSLGNLCPFCKGHHIVKHHGGWIVRQIDGSGGAVEWTSPTGRVYVVQPERHVPVFRARQEADAPF